MSHASSLVLFSFLRSSMQGDQIYAYPTKGGTPVCAPNLLPENHRSWHGSEPSTAPIGNLI